MKLAIVTASLDLEKSRECWSSWLRHSTLATTEFYFYPVVGHFGVVPAFLHGIEVVRKVHDPDIIACLHDDLRIDQPGWDSTVRGVFVERPYVGLVGFGGGKGLGNSEYDYKKTPKTHDETVAALARHDFVSNMQEAEAHGTRKMTLERVACLDGFSLIGRAAFMEDSFRFLHDKGIVHHAYDSWLGVLAKRHRLHVYMVPVRCHHYGGRTAVGSQDYQKWASGETPGGDQDFWDKSHRAFFDDVKGELPIQILKAK